MRKHKTHQRKLIIYGDKTNTVPDKGNMLDRKYVFITGYYNSIQRPELKPKSNWVEVKGERTFR